MKIALFSDTYTPEINGVAIHVAALKEGLESLGHEVLVVTTNPKNNDTFQEHGVLHCPSIKLKRIYGYGLSMPINMKQYQIIKKFNPDVIHIHTEFGIGLFGILVSKMLKRPVIYTLHTIYDDYVYYVVPKPLIKTGQRIFYKYIRSLYKRATVITGPSPKSHEYLINAGLHRNVEIIPNPVDVDRFSIENVSTEDIDNVKKTYNIPNDAFVGCIISRVGKEKSIDVLLNYIEKYSKVNKNFRFLIVGDGPAKADLEQQAKKLGINNVVIFTGKISNNKLLPYYAACDVFLTASLSDTNSISMLEAMSMGLPIIQRNDPINEGQVIENVNGFIFNDENNFIEKLNKVYKMTSEERAELKNKVRNSVIHSNTKNNMAAKIVDVYTHAIKIFK
ncbi:MAG: glycosyltransferase [Acutalibacteraceae bacterium]